MKTKNIIRGFIAFLLVAITMVSLAYADHTIDVTAFWTENNATTLTIEQGQDVEFFASIQSTSYYTLRVELLRGATLMRTIVPGTVYPSTVDDSSSSQRINVDTTGLAGTYTLRIHVVNIEGDATAYLTLDVNTAPTISITPDEYEVNEGETMQIMRIVGMDSDLDNLQFVARRVCNTLPYPNSLYCSVANIFNDPLDNNLYSTMTFDQERGQFTYSPGFGMVEHPATEEEFQMQFRAYDGENFSPWEYVTITVHDVNQIPEITSTPITSAAEGSAYRYRVVARDADTEDSFSYSFVQSPMGMTITNAGFIRWTPGYDQAGQYDVTVQVSDGIDSVEQVFTIIVDNTNRAPVLDAIGNQSVVEMELLTFTLSGSDDDRDLLTFSASDLPPGALFNPATRTFNWTPAFGQAGNYEVTFTVSDGILTDSETITISVGNVNRPPVLEPIGNRTVDEGSALRFTITASDADGDLLTFRLKYFDADEQGALFIDNGDGTATFKWTPTSTQAGVYNITFIVSDGDLEDVESITIKVMDVPAISVPQCSDGVDNDGDGLTDMNDLGCTKPADNDESNGLIPAPQCTDRVDNDGDGLIDMTDPGCSSPADNDESNTVVPPVEVCGNGIDDDGDGLVDESCPIPPLPQCSDFVDNDGDSLTDMNDPGCTSPADNDESNVVIPPVEICGDGIDNDLDGLVDESCPIPPLPQCSDFVDNDGDGLFDMNDPGCTSPADNDESNVVIPPTNNTPVLNTIGNRTIGENQTLQINPTATDIDGDRLTFFIQNQPAGSNFSTESGRFVWTPTFTQAGVYAVTFGVSDGRAEDKETIIITVTDTGEVIFGCTNPAAVNYRAQATVNDGSCLFLELSDLLELTRVQLSSEVVTAGDTLLVNVNVANEGDLNLENLRVTVLAYDLGLNRNTSRFDLNEGRTTSKNVPLSIPEGIPAGEYLLKITVGNRDHRESAYRFVLVR